MKTPMLHLARDDHGGVLVTSAVFLTAGLGAAALAIDLSHLWLAKRQLQASADLAAIAAVRVAGISKEQAEQAAEATVLANAGADAVPENVEWGTYDPSLAVADRFQADQNSVIAARVTATRSISLFFGVLFDPTGTVQLQAQGVAARPEQEPQASISIGSYALGLDEGLANQLLSELTGSTVSLDLMHYQALASADIDLFGIFDALQTEADLEAVTYDEIVAATVTVGDLLDAIATASDVTDVQTALSLLDGQIDTNAELALSAVADLGPLGELAVGRGSQALLVNAYDLLTASLEAANGDQQIALTTGIGLPGIAEVNVDIAIGERPQGLPWLGVDANGTTVRTAQTRLKLDVRLASLLNGVATVRVPLYIEVAAAEARIESVTCMSADPLDGVVDVRARTGLAEAWIGHVDPAAFHVFTGRPTVAAAELARLTLLSIVEVSVRAAGHVEVVEELDEANEEQLIFTEWHLDERVPLEQRIQTIGSTALVGSTLSSIQDADDYSIYLETRLLEADPLGLVMAAAQPLLAPILSSATGLVADVASPVDGLIDGLLANLGVKLGAADVRLVGLSCPDALSDTRLVM